MMRISPSRRREGWLRTECVTTGKQRSRFSARLSSAVEMTR